MKTTKSLKATGSDLADANHQIQLLEEKASIPKFEDKLQELDNEALRKFPGLGYERRLKRSRSSYQMLIF